MFTLAVIGCNRLHYLRNCVSSIRAFLATDLAAHRAELLVIDNASTEPGMAEYLAELAADLGRDYVKQFPRRAPNELYRAMTFAVDWSRARGHRFLNFIQDDCQWLRRDDSLLDRVAAGFDAMPDVAQIHTSLIWRDKFTKWTSEGGLRNVAAAGRHWLFFDRKPPCDTGFTRLALFDRIGTWPPHVSLKGEGGSELGEEWLYRRCSEIGAKRVWSLDPVLGMLFDAAYVRGYERIGRYIPPANTFYLRPWSDQQIASINANAAEFKPSFIEDFAIPDGWIPTSRDVRNHSGRTNLPPHPSPSANPHATATQAPTPPVAATIL